MVTSRKLRERRREQDLVEMVDEREGKEAVVIHQCSILNNERATGLRCPGPALALFHPSGDAIPDNGWEKRDGPMRLVWYAMSHRPGAEA